MLNYLCRITLIHLSVHESYHMHIRPRIHVSTRSTTEQQAGHHHGSDASAAGQPDILPTTTDSTTLERSWTASVQRPVSATRSRYQNFIRPCPRARFFASHREAASTEPSPLCSTTHQSLHRRVLQTLRTCLHQPKGPSHPYPHSKSLSPKTRKNPTFSIEKP